MSLYVGQDGFTVSRRDQQLGHRSRTRLDKLYGVPT
jgi:hypothetical protein